MEVNISALTKDVQKSLKFKGTLVNVCVFCGLSGCTIVVVSGRGKTASFIPDSNCPYNVRFPLKAAETSTKSGPCTNRPVCCDGCKAVVWSYNVSYHYKHRHNDYPTPATVYFFFKKKCIYLSRDDNNPS